MKTNNNNTFSGNATGTAIAVGDKVCVQFGRMEVS